MKRKKEEVKLKINTNKQRCKIALKKKIELMNLKYQKIMASKVFKDPTYKIKEEYIKIDAIIKNLEISIKTKINNSKTKAVETISKLDTLSPLKTLSRGYLIAQKENKTIKSINDVKKDDILDINNCSYCNLYNCYLL